MYLLDILLAIFPILLMLVMMMGFKWKGAQAGIAGWMAALLIALVRFGAGTRLLLWAQVRAAFQAFYILYIIWGALLFYRVTEAAGTITSMGELLPRLSSNRALQVLLLAWVFAAFLQGVGGFGVPVAVVAPLLIGMGFPAVPAVVMPSLGHTWAVSLGSLGSSFSALTTTTDVAEALLAPWNGVFLGFVCFLMGIATLWVAGGGTALREGALPLIVMGSAMAGGQWLAASNGLPHFAAMLGALAGLIVGSLWAILRNPEKDPLAGTRPILTRALLPYVLLLALIFAARFIPPVATVLNLIDLRVQVPQVATATGVVIPAGPTRSISLLGHTGALLVYASLLVWWLMRRRGVIEASAGSEIRRRVVRSGLRSTLGILAMVALAATMEHAGMITLLSQAMADAAGRLFPIVSPFIGALGAFVSGSNTSSNVLFGAFQRDVARALRYAVPVILSAQTAGGAIGSTFAPAKVMVGCSTVGLGDREGEVMGRLARYDLIALTALALFTWGLTSL
jgi:lactate permease